MCDACAMSPVLSDACINELKNTKDRQMTQQHVKKTDGIEERQNFKEMPIKFTNEITDFVGSFTADLLFVSDGPLPPINLQLANSKPSVFTSVILNTSEIKSSPNRSAYLTKFGHRNC